MQIGILQCGHTSEDIAARHGDFPDMFARLLGAEPFDYTAFDVEHMQFPREISQCDGWLLTGSRNGVYEEHAYIRPLEDFVRQVHAARIPLVGICFGHQLIAQALGGRVEKFAGGWSIGATDYAFEGLGSVRMNAWHQDQVVELPAQARPVGSSDFCSYAALAHEDHILSIQAHPEFESPLIADYVSDRRGTADYPDALMDAALDRLDLANSNDKIGALLRRFFLDAHARRGLREAG